MIGYQKDGDGQGGLACCDSWGRTELDTTERLNQTELKRTDYIISIPLDHEIFVACFMCLDMFQCLWFIVYGNLNRIYILLLCENYINLNYVELVYSTFRVYYIFLLFYIFILLIFESLILKLQLKILIYQALHL